MHMHTNLARTLVLALALCTVAATGAAQGPSTDIVFETLQTEPVPLQTGEYADIWLRVTNNGTSTAHNVEVDYVPSFPFSVDPDEQTSWDIGELVRGGTYHIHLQVRVDPNAVHGTNDLKFRVNSGGSSVSITKSVPVEVRTDDAALVVQDVAFPSTVSPGTANTLEFTLANLADSQLKNIDLSLNIGAEQPFGTAATTRKRVQSIEPGATARVPFDLYVDESAENGVYRIPLELDYENEAGTAFSRTESTGVVVGGNSQLEVAVDERSLMAAGSRGEVTLRIVNRGQGQARFVSMEIPDGEAYTVLSTRSVYLGNMDPDDYQTATFDIYADGGAEAVTLPVALTYKNAEGSQQTETRQVPVELFDAGELRRFDLGGGGSLVPILVVLVLAAAGGYWYWKRRKRQRRQDVEQG